MPAAIDKSAGHGLVAGSVGQLASVLRAVNKIHLAHVFHSVDSGLDPGSTLDIVF